MKNIIKKSVHLLIIALANLLINSSIFAQAPQKMSYQAVIRNSNDSLLVSTPVGMRISLVQGSPTGTVVFSETQTVTTNANGLVSLQIGMGTAVSGTFAGIDWAAGPYYVKTETDLSGGTNYTIISSNELLSVPYALFSANGTPGETGAQGPIGLTGATGPQGPAGADGAVGAVGAQGIQGIQGIQGETGAAGATGAIGPQGIAGTNGNDGATGPQGPQGLTGATGPQGEQGIQGLTGATGPQGPAGADGAVGAQGIQGETGATGLQGPQGLTGSAGPQGEQGIQGLTGATGPQGPAGADGAVGAQGIQGETGATGSTGPQGEQGIQGLSGATGPQGPAGADGAVGAQGIQGETGPQGPIGLTGPAGTNGSNAYQVAVANGYSGTETQWLESLQGPIGLTGATGPAGSFPPGTIAGEINYWNGTAWVTVAPGLSLPGNQALTLSLCNGVPTWGPCPAVLPTVTTTGVFSIANSSASSGGAVTSDGGATVSAWGVCWSTSANPTLANSFLQNTVSSGSFSSALSGLTQNTTYYVRAYATNSAGTAYGNQVSFTTANIVLLAIGQSYQGGIVAYILQAGDLGYDASVQHGLIAAPSDQGSAQWGCYGTLISGADGTAIGTGNQNTIDIMNGCSTAGIAARLCGDLVLGGYSDWYLPSRDELNQLYVNRVAVGGFAGSGYWSSSEDDSNGAWGQDFGNGGQFNYFKGLTFYVRAFRAF